MRAAYDEEYVEFISRLRDARKSVLLSQQQLAELLNKPQSYVSKVETCERRIDIVESARWCIAMKVRFEQLLPGSLSAAVAPTLSDVGRPKKNG